MDDADIEKIMKSFNGGETYAVIEKHFPGKELCII